MQVLYDGVAKRRVSIRLEREVANYGFVQHIRKLDERTHLFRYAWGMALRNLLVPLSQNIMRIASS